MASGPLRSCAAGWAAGKARPKPHGQQPQPLAFHANTGTLDFDDEAKRQIAEAYTEQLTMRGLLLQALSVHIPTNEAPELRTEFAMHAQEGRVP